MIVKDLLTLDDLILLTNNLESLDKEVKAFYASDLLSWVMGHAKEENTVLLTVLNTVNIIAVSVLLDFPAVIFCDDVIPHEDVIAKAKEENIPLFTTSLSSVQIMQKILPLLD